MNLRASVTILPDFCDDHALSSGNSNWLVFHVSISFWSRRSLLSEFDWPRKRASQPALSRNLAFLPEVENPTGREYYFSFSRTQRVAVSHERDSLHWPVNFVHPEV
jgi:hypothetical protein